MRIVNVPGEGGDGLRIRRMALSLEGNFYRMVARNSRRPRGIPRRIEVNRCILSNAEFSEIIVYRPDESSEFRMQVYPPIVPGRDCRGGDVGWTSGAIAGSKTERKRNGTIRYE